MVVYVCMCVRRCIKNTLQKKLRVIWYTIALSIIGFSGISGNTLDWKGCSCFSLLRRVTMLRTLVSFQLP